MTQSSHPVGGHTPAPWTLSTLRTTSGMCHQIGPFPWREGHPNHACIYVDGQYHSDRMTDIQRELEANARLISAAPDLLAALQHIIDGALSLPRFAEQQARAAIAKATGEPKQ